jgi:hypothetical protein
VQLGAEAGLDFMPRAWLGLVADITTIDPETAAFSARSSALT